LLRERTVFDRLSYREPLQLDDDDLQQAILDRLQDDPAYLNGRRLRVTVEVYDGDVSVRGSVRTALERRKVDIVARALGATTVKNEIVVEPPAEARQKVGRSR